MPKVYIYDNIDQFTDELLKKLLSVMPAERRNKAMAFKRPIDRKLSALAWLVLSIAMDEVYHIEVPPVAVSDKGKPYFPSRPDIFFNLSHCKKAVVCVVSSRPVGIDVEIARYREGVAQTVFSQEQMETIRQGNADIEFARFWTMKESYVKYTGEGLAGNLRDSDSEPTDVDFTTTVCDKGYVYTVCTRKFKPDAKVKADDKWRKSMNIAGYYTSIDNNLPSINCIIWVLQNDTTWFSRFTNQTILIHNQLSPNSLQVISHKYDRSI